MVEPDFDPDLRLETLSPPDGYHSARAHRPSCRPPPNPFPKRCWQLPECGPQFDYPHPSRAASVCFFTNHLLPIGKRENCTVLQLMPRRGGQKISKTVLNMQRRFSCPNLFWLHLNSFLTFMVVRSVIKPSLSFVWDNDKLAHKETLQMSNKFLLVFATVAAITFGSSIAAFYLAVFIDPLSPLQAQVLDGFERICTLGVGAIFGVLSGKQF